MATKITMIFAVAVIALASTAFGAGNGNRANAYKLAQYCVPQDDIPGAQSIYC